MAAFRPARRGRPIALSGPKKAPARGGKSTVQGKAGGVGGFAFDRSVRAALAKSYARRVTLLGAAIDFAVQSPLVTATPLIAAFLAALAGIAHGGIVAMMFVVALAMRIASLVQFTREIRLQVAIAHLD
jgi:hypothetical protein